VDHFVFFSLFFFFSPYTGTPFPQTCLLYQRDSINQATFLLFQPEVGQELEGQVKSVQASSLTCSLHGVCEANVSTNSAVSRLQNYHLPSLVGKDLLTDEHA
jgi:hypothetical protein